MLTSSTSMPWSKIFIANISDSKALGCQRPCQEGGDSVVKFYINAMAKDIPNISDSKALDVKVHVRREPCQEGAMLGEGDNVDKFYINAMAKYIPNISDSKALGVRDHVRRGGTMLTSSTSMPWSKIFIANISDSKTLGCQRSCQEGAMSGGGTMLTSSTSMPWAKIFIANLSDSKAFGVRVHVRGEMLTSST